MDQQCSHENHKQSHTHEDQLKEKVTQEVQNEGRKINYMTLMCGHCICASYLSLVFI